MDPHCIKPLLVIALACATVSAGAGWSDPHILKILPFVQPSGPGQTITTDLVLSPADVTVYSYNIKIGYDNRRLTNLSVTNNTTEPSTRFTVGLEQPDNEVAYANVSCTVLLEGDYDVIPPPSGPYFLGHITIKTRPDFSAASGPVSLYLRGWPRPPDSGIYTSDGRAARLISMTYESAIGTAGVADWALY